MIQNGRFFMGGRVPCMLDDTNPVGKNRKAVVAITRGNLSSSSSLTTITPIINTTTVDPQQLDNNSKPKKKKTNKAKEEKLFIDRMEKKVEEKMESIISTMIKRFEDKCFEIVHQKNKDMRKVSEKETATMKKDMELVMTQNMSKMDEFWKRAMLQPLPYNHQVSKKKVKKRNFMDILGLNDQAPPISCSSSRSRKSEEESEEETTTSSDDDEEAKAIFTEETRQRSSLPLDEKPAAAAATTAKKAESKRHHQRGRSVEKKKPSSLSPPPPSDRSSSAESKKPHRPGKKRSSPVDKSRESVSSSSNNNNIVDEKPQHGMVLRKRVARTSDNIMIDLNHDNCDDDDIILNDDDDNNNNKAEEEDNTYDENGWGSELSDKELEQLVQPPASSSCPLFTGNDEKRGENVVKEKPEEEEEEAGQHKMLKRMIQVLHEIPIAEHDLLDSVWVNLSSMNVHGPTRTDIEDPCQRQGEMLCILSALYDRVDEIAKAQGKEPDDIYMELSASSKKN